MKTLITSESKDYLTLSTLQGREFIAYRSKTYNVHNKVTYCVMTKFKSYKEDEQERVPTQFGFICLGALDSPARFVSSSWDECLRKASKCRDIKVFDTQEEMLNAMSNQTF